MAQLVTLEAVKSGLVDVEDLLKLNALIDMREVLNQAVSRQNSGSH